MVTIIQIVFVIALLKYCLKAALSNNLFIIIGYSAALALIALALYPIVINQPMTIISDMLGSKVFVENLALITTAESILEIMISIFLLENYFLPKNRRKKSAKFLKIMPGILVFFAVAYFELLFFKARAGHDFLFTALLFSAILLLGATAISLIIKYVITNESLKLEIKVILNLAILALGLLVSSSVADYNISYAQTVVEWKPLISITIGFFVLAIIGFIFHKINFYNHLKNIFNKQK